MCQEDRAVTCDQYGQYGELGVEFHSGRPRVINAEHLASAGLRYVILSGWPHATIKFGEVVGTRGPLCTALVPTALNRNRYGRNRWRSALAWERIRYSSEPPRLGDACRSYDKNLFLEHGRLTVSPRPWTRRKSRPRTESSTLSIKPSSHRISSTSRNGTTSNTFDSPGSTCTTSLGVASSQSTTSSGCLRRRTGDLECLSWGVCWGWWG